MDSTTLHILSTIAKTQATPTENTLPKTNQFLDYMATQPVAVTRFYEADMILNVHLNASYLTASKAQSQVGRHFFLANKPKDN